MITFLPYSITKSHKIAQCLDYKRLGKQRVEAKQVLDMLAKYQVLPLHLKHHPLLLMWKGNEDALAFYYNAMILEWTKRGYKNTMKAAEHEQQFVVPFWDNHPILLLNHRLKLLLKKRAHYAQYFPLTEEKAHHILPDLKYEWPLSATEKPGYIELESGYYVNERFL